MLLKRACFWTRNRPSLVIEMSMDRDNNKHEVECLMSTNKNGQLKGDLNAIKKIVHMCELKGTFSFFLEKFPESCCRHNSPGG